MQGKDVRVVTTTPNGRADCAEPLTALLEQQGVLIKAVNLALNGNTLRFGIVRSDDVEKFAELKLPIPTHAAQNATTGLIEMLDAENKVLFTIPNPNLGVNSHACGSSTNPRAVVA